MQEQIPTLPNVALSKMEVAAFLIDANNQILHFCDFLLGICINTRIDLIIKKHAIIFQIGNIGDRLNTAKKNGNRAYYQSPLRELIDNFVSIRNRLTHGYNPKMDWSLLINFSHCITENLIALLQGIRPSKSYQKLSSLHASIEKQLYSRQLYPDQNKFETLFDLIKDLDYLTKDQDLQTLNEASTLWMALQNCASALSVFLNSERPPSLNPFAKENQDMVERISFIRGQATHLKHEFQRSELITLINFFQSTLKPYLLALNYPNTVYSLPSTLIQPAQNQQQNPSHTPKRTPAAIPRKPDDTNPKKTTSTNNLEITISFLNKKIIDLSNEYQKSIRAEVQEKEEMIIEFRELLAQEKKTALQTSSVLQNIITQLQNKINQLTFENTHLQNNYQPLYLENIKQGKIIQNQEKTIKKLTQENETLFLENIGKDETIEELEKKMKTILQNNFQLLDSSKNITETKTENIAHTPPFWSEPDQKEIKANNFAPDSTTSLKDTTLKAEDIKTVHIN